MVTAGNVITVGAEEAGQKLLQFLLRRLGLPKAMLHRWIRKGAVRIDGGRSDPYQRLREGQLVRLPPFAAAVAGTDIAAPIPLLDARSVTHAAGLALIGTHGNIWAIAKPAGLAVHPGTGCADSLSARLAAAAQGAAFVPTPAHRLDRETSGIVLVAGSFAALAELHTCLRDRTLTKEYLAWVKGQWPHTAPQTLTHALLRDAEGRMRIAHPTSSGDPPHGALIAVCETLPLVRKDTGSLLLMRLLTGRKHQLRLQAAAAGHPVIGDRTYGDPAGTSPLLLHACRVILPDGTVFTHLPGWPNARSVAAIPPPDRGMSRPA